MKTKYIFISILSVFAGCATGTDPKISMQPPVYVEELPSRENGLGQSNPGSLFGRGDNPLFSDRKAMNVNDIVTIVIEETTSQTSKANKATEKDSTISLNGGAFTTPNGSPLSGPLRDVNKIAGIGFSGGGSNKYSGSGSNSRNEAFNTTISARIIKVLNNGNYFIEGSKELLVNNEKQIIQISGVIRPYDISQKNEIESKYIADAKILYKTEGEIQRATKKPWGTSLLEAIWPF
ncbi:flagellar basal body L-ring protein FlgH [Campylobacter hyointestinalis]|uniref:flagellar basal body L-ring protein FlgH n=1 Tax=Campylobacter hyointestinalis TaxID=198 RepID=UPI000CE43590|nr:flagellar basal body L-ring protein FlgH [Campylobacter hyointestinalis]PPB73194.1 flagellar basal body L-ring protein [Campylobacter hyointestinalis subsp. hyointestinalis]PPB74097.1 flagellar basal body L-ring protein [Campylobacter hyointestinalis subsp. hyointestinalis]PPB76090.1 flagellar basal body L-ring protein [Campylobacter hyointestinalis subsp. hyointestinalis]PPB76834.1 flagellar basal body L-ring protein [Campylobacter hyointestinalis subsp. hyointestinalis]